MAAPSGFLNAGGLDVIQEEIQRIIEISSDQKEKQKVLKEVDEIGNVISSALLTLLLELGKISRREIASLVGLAPHSYESGQKIGYRRTKGGRKDIRCILFMAAMTTSKSKGKLGEFYKGMLNRGKKRKWLL